MAFSAAAVLGLIASIGKFLSFPIVNKFVDNLVKKTTTSIDDEVWAFIEEWLVTGGDFETGIADLQARYDAGEFAGKPPATQIPAVMAGEVSHPDGTPV